MEKSAVRIVYCFVWSITINMRSLMKPQKEENLFLNGSAIKPPPPQWLKGHAIKENITFFNLFFPTAKVPTSNKVEGGGVKALMALPLKRYFFYGFPRGRRPIF